MKSSYRPNVNSNKQPQLQNRRRAPSISSIDSIASIDAYNNDILESLDARFEPNTQPFPNQQPTFLPAGQIREDAEFQALAEELKDVLSPRREGDYEQTQHHKGQTNEIQQSTPVNVSNLSSFSHPTPLQQPTQTTSKQPKPPSRQSTSVNHSQSQSQSPSQHQHQPGNTFSNNHSFTQSFHRGFTRENWVVPYDDHDVEKISQQIDTHTLAMKKAVMSAFLDMKKSIYSKHNEVLYQQQQQLSQDYYQSQQEILYLNQLISQHQHLNQHNHIVIERLVYQRATKAEQGYQFRVMKQIFVRWLEASKLNKNRRNYHQATVKFLRAKFSQNFLRKIITSWRADAHRERGNKVDNFWKGKLEEVSQNIIVQYEQELSRVRQTLTEAHQEISSFDEQRAKFQNEMKKAFMRGVCALNLEAMSMFKSPVGAPASVGGVGDFIEAAASQNHNNNSVSSSSLQHASQQPDKNHLFQESFVQPPNENFPPQHSSFIGDRPVSTPIGRQYYNPPPQQAPPPSGPVKNVVVTRYQPHTSTSVSSQAPARARPNLDISTKQKHIMKRVKSPQKLPNSDHVRLSSFSRG